MNALATKFLAKLIIIPALFSFAVTCCHPAFAQALEPASSQPRIQTAFVNHSTDQTIKSEHRCDHEKNLQTQSAVQSPVQKILAKHIPSQCSIPAISFFQNLPINPEFIARNRITGPPWEGKSIKGFLGVYRS